VIPFFLASINVVLFVMKDLAIWKEESEDVEQNVRRLKNVDTLVNLLVTQQPLVQKISARFRSRLLVLADIVRP